MVVKHATMTKTKRKKTALIEDYHLLTYEEIDSTNDEARRLAEGGAAHGAFIWAHRQLQGRGRQGREWVSHDGNLFVSVLLEPDCQVSRIPQLSFIAALAAAESIAPLLDDESRLRCKWPNDLLLDGKKLAGLLLESFETTNEYGTTKRWAVIGLGLNIDSCPDDPELNIPATYLKEAGVELVSAKIILSRFIHHFMEWYGVWQKKGFPAVRSAWLERACGLGEEIRVQQGQDELIGLFADVDAKGNLVLTLVDGSQTTISAGDVYLT